MHRTRAWRRHHIKRLKRKRCTYMEEPVWRNPWDIAYDKGPSDFPYVIGPSDAKELASSRWDDAGVSSGSSYRCGAWGARWCKEWDVMTATDGFSNHAHAEPGDNA